MRFPIILILIAAFICCLPIDAYGQCAGGSCGVGRGRPVAQARENASNRRANGRGLARLAPRNWRLFGGCN